MFDVNSTDLDMEITKLQNDLYLAESAFSDMNIKKSENRNSLTDEHHDESLRLSVASYNPDFEKIAKPAQCQRSH